MAQKGKQLAETYASLYKSEVHKKVIFNLIYDLYVIYNYRAAVNYLKILLKSGKLDDQHEEKEKIGAWLIYAHGHFLAASILTQKTTWIDLAKKIGEELDELLISKGLGKLVAARTKYSLETIKHDTYSPHFSGTLRTIGSLFGLISEDHKPSNQDLSQSLPKRKDGSHLE